MILSKILQLQYQGFLETDVLWFSNKINGIYQFDFQHAKTSVFNASIKENLRLGKLVERFVSHQLQEDDTIEILVENIQIQDNKITLGELDCILLQHKKPIHLEIIYKFYLYDETVGATEIAHWIGPNRKDSFKQKLDKLVNKQLPILYNTKTKPLIETLGLSLEEIAQQVYFKGQLFVPYKKYGEKFEAVNNNCIEGFYIYLKDLLVFKEAKFYIPTKRNWLVKPHTVVDWLNFDTFKNDIMKYMDTKNAPLCWMKKTNGELIKFFVVWW